MKKIVFVGCGNVGISTIYALINQKVAIDEIIIIDTNKAKTQGEILDFKNGLSYLNLNLKISLGTYKDCADAQIVVISAGAKQKENQTRMDLLKDNVTLIKNIVQKIILSGFKGIFINATNPVDVITYLIYKVSKFDSSKVIGTGTSLDTARLKEYIKEELNTPSNNIQAYVIGEHGDSSFVAYSHLLIDNLKGDTLLTCTQKDNIEKKVRNTGYELLNTKGFSSSAIGLCLVDIIKSIINNEDKVICISCFEKNIYYGHPAHINENGVVKKINLKLTHDEEKKLNDSLQIIKKAIDIAIS